MRRAPTTHPERRATDARDATAGIRRRGARRVRIALASGLVAGLVGGCTAEPTPRAATDSAVVKTRSAPVASDPLALHVEQRIAGMTLAQKVAALVMIHVPGTDPAAIRAAVEPHGFGGVIIMGDNVVGGRDSGEAVATAAVTSALHADAGLPLLTAVDQEGGDVRRLPGDALPAGDALHALDPAGVEAAFAARAELVEAAGVLINFGVIADIAPDGLSFIGPRTLGATPERAGERVAAAVRGERGSALSTLKHFPGHGASPDDSHVSIPSSSMAFDEWRATHAVPFAAGIEAGAPLVMTGHLRFERVSPLPASLSPTWIRILRDELDFDGVVVTDDLLMLQRSGDPAFADPMENGVRALAAGSDLLLYVLPADPATVGFDAGRLVDALVAAVESGRVAEPAVDASLRRVLALRRAASAESGPFVDCGLKCAGASPRARASDG